MVAGKGAVDDGRRENPELGEFSNLDLVQALLHRLGDGAVESQRERRLFGWLAAELETRTLHPANRYSTARSELLLHRLREHPEFEMSQLRGATCVDVGCGGLNPLGGLMILLMLGAARGIGIDQGDVASWRLAVRAVYRCAADMLARAALPWMSMDRARLAEQVADFEFRKLAAGDETGIPRERLEFRSADASATGLPSASVDMLTSVSFLEHADDPDAVLAEMSRITKPGGLAVHAIDGTDHRHWYEKGVGPLDFLREESDQALVYGSNRLRPLHFGDLFDRHGFDVAAVRPDPARRVRVDDRMRASFAEPFRSMATEVLEVTSAQFCLIKR